jgi:hypothetical protein
MSLVVPTFRDPFYSQRTQLDGVEYVFHFQFNSREGRWYVDLYDLSGNQVRTGVKIRANFLTARGEYVSRPAGVMMCVDLQNPDNDQLSRDPGLLELGDRWLLFYFEAA